MKKVTKAQLQPSFRQKDLISVNSFIGFCQKYDIGTTKDELEYFEKEGLLYPVVRVNRGLVEYKRVLADYDGKGSEEWRFIPKEHIARAKKQYKFKEIDKATTYGHGSILMGKDRIGSSNDIVWCWFGKVIVNYTWGVTLSCRPFLICVYWHLPNALIRHACTE